MRLVQKCGGFFHYFYRNCEKVAVKRRMGGYDGRGQWIVDKNNQNVIGNEVFGEVIAEKFISFDYEISFGWCKV